jgi:hypothetical protein
MDPIVQTDNRIEITERMSTGLRVFLVVLGLFPWIAPYELLIKPGWSGFNLSTLGMSVISLGAIAVSLAFIGASIFGLNQTLTIDRTRRTITHAYEAVAIPMQVKTYSFGQVQSIEIVEHDWESGPSTYSLKFTFNDGHHTATGSLSSCEEAMQWKEKIEGWLHL